MADTVAIVSVASSGAVALGGLLLNALGARSQRAHERRQAYEGRAWEKKTSGLFDVIAAARSLVDAIDNQDPRRTIDLPMAVYDTRRRMRGAVAIVEAYASRPCREEFVALRR